MAVGDVDIERGGGSGGLAKTLAFTRACVRKYTSSNGLWHVHVTAHKSIIIYCNYMEYNMVCSY